MQRINGWNVNATREENRSLYIEWEGRRAARCINNAKDLIQAWKREDGKPDTYTYHHARINLQHRELNAQDQNGSIGPRDGLDHTWRDKTWRYTTWRYNAWWDKAWRDKTWHYRIWRYNAWWDKAWRDKTWRDKTWQTRSDKQDLTNKTWPASPDEQYLTNKTWPARPDTQDLTSKT